MSAFKSPHAGIQLTEEQNAVVEQILEFLDDPNPSKPYFIVNGLAGSGKSTVLAHLADLLPDALVCAFTGKAASVLKRKMNRDTYTIHQAIYRFCGLDEETAEPIFSRKHRDDTWQHHTVLLDEHSMVGRYLANDLVKTGARIVAFGDPGQLPPVKDAAFFNTPPDATLETIHRQAQHSPIIRQAHAVRQNYHYQPDGTDFMVTKTSIQPAIWTGADIVLCWRNQTRHALNHSLRQWRGVDPRSYPQAGEPVMCLRNNHDKALMNGAIYTLITADRSSNGNRYFTIENERKTNVKVRVAVDAFDEVNKEDDTITPFAFAYAATVHKAQGSEYERVILVDEYNRPHERERWLYTGLTRASKQIIVQDLVS